MAKQTICYKCKKCETIHLMSVDGKYCTCGKWLKPCYENNKDEECYNCRLCKYEHMNHEDDNDI